MPIFSSTGVAWRLYLDNRVVTLCLCDCLPLCASHSVGRPKHVRVMAGALEGDLFIGPKAEVANAQTHTHTSSVCVDRKH